MSTQQTQRIGAPSPDQPDSRGKDGVISADPDTLPRVVLRAPLPHDDLACKLAPGKRVRVCPVCSDPQANPGHAPTWKDELSAGHLDAEVLGNRWLLLAGRAT